MAKRRIKLSEQIRRAVDDCGQTRAAIGQAADIDESTLSRFMSGERGLSMKTLDRLADYLDLNITLGKRRNKGR